ncbi:NIF system FeS cluster assembly, NifU, C-terminal [Sesbania bispinosa]|nr:NIF system FeS cluster assembly, NifU, C-terminal [Sesbania bispinosa]
MSLLHKTLSRGFGIHNHNVSSLKPSLSSKCSTTSYRTPNPPFKTTHIHTPNSPLRSLTSGKPRRKLKPLSASLPVPPPLDLTEDNILQVLADARTVLGQIFDTSVGITGVVELADLDGPFVKIRLKGRFWHKRTTVVARVGNYLKQRIPEILEVEIEDEKQLDDSPENF